MRDEDFEPENLAVPEHLQSKKDDHIIPWNEWKKTIDHDPEIGEIEVYQWVGSNRRKTKQVGFLWSVPMELLEKVLELRGRASISVFLAFWFYRHLEKRRGDWVKLNASKVSKFKVSKMQKRRGIEALVRAEILDHKKDDKGGDWVKLHE